MVARYFFFFHFFSQIRHSIGFIELRGSRKPLQTKGLVSKIVINIDLAGFALFLAILEQDLVALTHLLSGSRNH
jgi:hypothetical protein